MNDRINMRLRKHSFTMEMVSDFLIPDIERLAKIIIEKYREGKKLILMGNGGSAADAQHITSELVGKFLKERNPLPAISLTTNTSNLTSISNDYTFDHVFERQLYALMNEGDIVIGISTSGNSPNIINALKKAKELSGFTVALTGRDGGEIVKYADLSIIVPFHHTPHIQEAHITIGHILCDLIEEELFPSQKRACFLDRDGTINEDKGYVYKIEDLVLLPNVIEGLKMLQKKFLLIVATNQSGVERGYYTKEDVEKFHRYLYYILSKEGVFIEDFYYCPNLEGDCRKPNPGMLIQAAKEWNVSLKNSYTIGDKISDIEAGKNAGCKTILIGKEDPLADYSAKNILEAARWILERD
ncbi:MAG: HAD-IIIA family hydrolase [Dictyoglomaceae bacterium]|nr:HAD-IIIA family hydrolase [Dictyoglomaceae bacterium]